MVNLVLYERYYTSRNHFSPCLVITASILIASHLNRSLRLTYSNIRTTDLAIPSLTLHPLQAMNKTLHVELSWLSSDNCESAGPEQAQPMLWWNPEEK